MYLPARSIKEKDLLRVMEKSIKEHEDELVVQSYVMFEEINIDNYIRSSYTSNKARNEEIRKVLDLIWKRHRLIPILEKNMLKGWVNSVG